MTIPTEPIGSIPRPLSLIDAVSERGADDPAPEPLYESAVRDSVERFEATGSPIISDGEQHKYHNFWTYCVHGLPNAAPDGFKIPFSAGHTRRMPRLTRGPFRYRRYADSYLDVALRYAHVPVKQAVISPSALSLMYPAEGLPGYSREQFIDDLLREHEAEIRRCLAKGACTVQIDFTEGRLPMKSIRPGTCSTASSISTTSRCRVSPNPSVCASAYIRVREQTVIPRTARTSATRRCCPACSSSRSATSTSRSPVRRPRYRSSG